MISSWYSAYGINSRKTFQNMVILGSGPWFFDFALEACLLRIRMLELEYHFKKEERPMNKIGGNVLWNSNDAFSSNGCFHDVNRHTMCILYFIWDTQTLKKNNSKRPPTRKISKNIFSVHCLREEIQKLAFFSFLSKCILFALLVWSKVRHGS